MGLLKSDTLGDLTAMAEAQLKSAIYREDTPAVSSWALAVIADRMDKFLERTETLLEKLNAMADDELRPRDWDEEVETDYSD